MPCRPTLKPHCHRCTSKEKGIILVPFLVRSCLALFISALLVSPLSLAFDTPLSDQAVREAYFLGQRRDESTAEFLDKYRRHLPLPESGPWISTVEFFTPFAEAVELSRQRSFGYSAQDAAQDYRNNGDRLRVTITIEFTDSYGEVSQVKSSQRSGSPNGFSVRPSNFWKDFTYRLFDGDEVVEPLEMHGNPTFRTVDNSTVMTGAQIVLIYDAGKLSSSSDAAIVVDFPDYPQLVAPFDLTTLR
jgi:hypothetical protein